MERNNFSIFKYNHNIRISNVYQLKTHVGQEKALAWSWYILASLILIACVVFDDELF